MQKRSTAPHPLVEELANALQAALLLSASLQQQLATSEWGHDATQLSSAVNKAAHAAHRLRYWAQDIQSRTRRGLR